MESVRASAAFTDALLEWCDSGDGWGPFKPGDRNSLTPCFSSTVLELPVAMIFLYFGFPRVIMVLWQPEVNPAASCQYIIKLMLSTMCLFMSIFLTFTPDPVSLSEFITLSVISFAWLIAHVLLVMSYHRHLPLYKCVQLWWYAQFLTSIFIFVTRFVEAVSPAVYIIRGVYCVCCLCLCAISILPKEQPLYTIVDLMDNDDQRYDFSPAWWVRSSFGRYQSAELENSALDLDGTTLRIHVNPDQASGTTQNTISLEADNMTTPRESYDEEYERTKVGYSSIPTNQPGAFRPRHLSNNLLMTNATNSNYSRPLLYWNQTLYGDRYRVPDLDLSQSNCSNLLEDQSTGNSGAKVENESEPKYTTR